MSRTILLVGCGQLGSRHLQALSLSEDVQDVYVVDGRSQSLALGQTRLKEVGSVNSGIRFHWETQIPVQPQADVCVVATLAQGRVEIIKEIAQKNGCQKFLIEKLVAPSIDEYQELLKFAQENGLSVWVNCKVRSYGIHRYVKSCLKDGEPICFSVGGGNHGLACNGVHMADLFAFYTGAAKIDVLSAHVDFLLHPSKRGKDLFDLSGTLCGAGQDSRFILSYAKDHMAPEYILIVTPYARFAIDHAQRFAHESYKKESWTWRPITINEDWKVSTMTRTFVNDILTKGTCALPSLEECFPAHEFILLSLHPFFNRLLKNNQAACPVT